MVCGDGGRSGDPYREQPVYRRASKNKMVGRGKVVSRRILGALGVRRVGGCSRRDMLFVVRVDEVGPLKGKALSLSVSSSRSLKSSTLWMDR